jgi:L-amino acid N-acyltransferase YncA
MFFREATETDIVSIVAINNESVLPGIANGFVLDAMQGKEVAAILSRRQETIYVSGVQGAVDAFVLIAPGEDREVLDKVRWQSVQERYLFLTRSRLYIKKIAVHPAVRRRGRATFLYTALFDIFPARLFYAFITRAPVDNRSSVQFHQSMHFRISGNFASTVFSGLRNYRSELYVRFP